MRRLLVALFIPALFASIMMSPAHGGQGKLSSPLQSLLQTRPSDTHHLVWVFFSDKGVDPQLRMGEAKAVLTPKALARRAARATMPSQVEFEDLPLVPGYVQGVAGLVTRVRNESRWFNAVSVEATARQVEALQVLPYVARLDIVRTYRRGKDENLRPMDAATLEDQLQHTASADDSNALNYGQSFGQLNQIHVPPVHDMNINGSGVIVAMLDAGFNNLAHECFATLKVMATRDFVNGGTNVADGLGRMGEGSHGTYTLSTIAGFKEGRLIGPAYAATFLLAKTENTDSETPLEEDNWAAAAEWAEGLGADVISSSLGYLTFDAPYPSYTWRDMDGATAISTKAADLAAARGVVVVNSAGNEGPNSQHNTLGAPADGKRVIAAGAVNSLGSRVIFSSVGPTADGRIKPDVMAQGSQVTVASSRFNNQYGQLDGTSFSCPLTAGVAALLLQAHPNYTVDQVISLFHSTASNAASPNSQIGWGIVNALAAIQAPVPGN